MTIEDLGLEPDFEELDDPKKKKKSKRSRNLSEQEPEIEKLKNAEAEAEVKKPPRKKLKKAKSSEIPQKKAEGETSTMAKKPPKKHLNKKTKKEENEPQVAAPTSSEPEEDSLARAEIQELVLAAFRAELASGKVFNRKQTRLFKRQLHEKFAAERGLMTVPSSSSLKATQKEKKELKPAAPKQKKWMNFKEIDEKYRELIQKLMKLDSKQEVVASLNSEETEGRISKEESAEVLQRWVFLQKEKTAKHVTVEVMKLEDLSEVKKVLGKLSDQEKIFRKDVKIIIDKWKNRERRRLERIKEREEKSVCFHCRQSGHKLADCPTRNEEAEMSAEAGICFKCGSGEHTVHQCTRKNIKGYPFAICFICKGEGHLSSQCEENVKGIYPDGGSCSVCGSVKHLKRNCPELASQKKDVEEKKVKVSAMSAMSRADEEDDALDAPEPAEVRKKKKKKIVKF